MVEGRTRRSPAEVRELITAAARDLFTEQGFERTSTAAIAERAGVIKAAVFRHFGTKEALFEQVALAPLYQFVEGFVQDWEPRVPEAGVDLEVTRAYVGGLLKLIRENRLLFSMLATEVEGNRFERSGHFAQQMLDRHLADLERRSAVQAEANRRRVMDLALGVRFATALVLGVALFHHTLFPDGAVAPSDDELANELAGYILRGSIAQE